MKNFAGHARGRIAADQVSRISIFLRHVGIFALALCCASCASSRGGNLSYGIDNLGTPDAPSIDTISADYQIAPLDKLIISVFQADKFSGEYKVDLTGHIAMPLLGNVMAAQKTAGELKENLRTLLAERYLKDPDVTVGIAEAGGSKLTIDGSVKEPGVFPIYGKTTLLQAIAMAKGLDPAANPKRIAIFRQVEGKRMGAAFDLTTIRSGEDSDPEVFRGDVIVVDGSRTRKTLQDIVSTMPLLGLFRPLGF